MMITPYYCQARHPPGCGDECWEAQGGGHVSTTLRPSASNFILILDKARPAYPLLAWHGFTSRAERLKHSCSC